MLSKTYNLCIALDKECMVNEDLIVSNSLYKLDSYIKGKFYDTKDIRKEFEEEISIFALDNIERITYLNKKNKDNRMGHIVILEKVYKDNTLLRVRPIKVIYHGFILPKRSICLKKIKNSLMKDDKLNELYYRKRYLLSQNEIDLLGLYFRFHNEKYKKSALYFLVQRIKEETSQMAYYYCRMLTNLCDLLEEDKEIKNEEQIVEQLSMDKLLRK